MKLQRWLWIVGVVLVLAILVGGVWFWRSKNSSTLAGHPVPTPDFEVAATPANALSLMLSPDDEGEGRTAHLAATSGRWADLLKSHGTLDA